MASSSENAIEWSSLTYLLLQTILLNKYYYSQNNTEIDSLFNDILDTGWTVSKVQSLIEILNDGYYHSDLRTNISALLAELISNVNDASGD